MTTKRDEVSNKVAVLETRVSIAGVIATVILVPWLGWLSFRVVGMSDTLAAIRQAEKDRGVDIVSRIEQRKNPALQQAALQVASAQLNEALVSKLKPDTQKLKNVSNAITAATEVPSPSPQAWQAAANLISYKSAATTNFLPSVLPPCGLGVEGPDFFTAENIGNTGIQYQNCVLNINDRESFSGDKYVRRYKALSGGVGPPTYLVNGVLVFDPSEPIIDTPVFTCVNCRFIVKQSVPEGGAARAVVRSLLASDGLNFKVSMRGLPSSGQESRLDTHKLTDLQKKAHKG